MNDEPLYLFTGTLNMYYVFPLLLPKKKTKVCLTIPTYKACLYIPIYTYLTELESPLLYAYL